MNDVRKLKSINVLNIVTFITFALFIILLILWIISRTTFVYDPIFDESNSIFSISAILAISILLILSIFINFGLLITLGVKILGAWKNKEINEIKTVWGILTIIILGPIASLVFYINAKKIIINSVDENNKNK